MSRSALITGQGPSRAAATVGLSDNAKIGSGCAFHLSEPSAINDPAGGPPQPNPNTWIVEVYVQVGEGEFLLGSFTTTAVSAGSRAARTVAIAYCPGATEWRAVVRGEIGATCRLVLTSDECCYGGTYGLVGVNGTLVSDEIVSPPFFLVQQGLIAAGPGTLLKLRGYVDPAGAPIYVGPVDKTLAVVNGDAWLDVPYQILAVGTIAGNFEITWRNGLRFVNAIRWAASTTSTTVTLGPFANVGAIRS